MLRAALATLLLLMDGCATALTDPNRWEIGPGEYPRFASDSDVCRDQASHPLQPELEGTPMDRDVYRRCMEGLGWRQRQAVR